ncbi:hypothetical protein Poly30_28560 [Planctomycetes bacterium Poly30]|uniref:PD-(D/E)XK nuclease superfamily protein n=1 Tax=Saltatorellus ferox TaxID=2528018 RepID=A0A518ETD5_9BACT|nr:hypothetical protein Poly30_28560 [Planctomycetes bacterium Poly30]
MALAHDASVHRSITKTSYLLGRQCPRRQWLGHHGVVEPAVTEAAVLALQIEASREVESLAAELFPGALRVCREGEATTPYVGVEGTKRALAEAQAVLQAHFEADGLAAISDIVEVRAEGLYLWEVKSSTYEAEGDDDEARANPLYDWDLAYQVHVAREAGNVVIGAGLILLRKEYVRGGGPVRAEEVLIRLDRSAEVAALAARVAEEVAAQQSMLRGSTMPTELPGPRCKGGRKVAAGNRPSDCGHFLPHGVCGRELPVFWAGSLPNLAGGKIALVTGTPGLKIEDLDPNDPAAKWTETQRRVIEGVQTRDEVVDHVPLREKLDELEWPLSFVDLEFDPTMAIPRHPGMRPYDRVPFQWALAIEEECGGGAGGGALLPGAHDSRSESSVRRVPAGRPATDRSPGRAPPGRGDDGAEADREASGRRRHGAPAGADPTLRRHREDRKGGLLPPGPDVLLLDQKAGTRPDGPRLRRPRHRKRNAGGGGVAPSAAPRREP